MPVLPGYHGDDQSSGRARAPRAGVGFPLIIKPSGGGGGKGMHIVNGARSGSRKPSKARSGSRPRAFKDDRLLLERYLAGSPSRRSTGLRGYVTAPSSQLFDQRLFGPASPPKLIEEAPAPGLDDAKARRGCTPPPAPSRRKWATSGPAPSSSC